MLDLLDEFSKLTRALDARGVEYAVCGGLALAVYGIPRATIDIDLLIDAESLALVEVVAAELGYRFAAAPMSFKGGAVQIRRVSKIDAGSGDVLMLDLLLVTAVVQPAWAGRIRVPWFDSTVCVVSRAGLIGLKSLRGSGQDQDDIRKLEELDDEA